MHFMNFMHYSLYAGFGIIVTPWKIIGYLGLCVFSGRWLVQMLASRQAGKSVLPITFWYLSATGSSLLLMDFGFGHPDMVGFVSNLFPLSISLYNLHLVNRERRAGLEPSAVEELPLSPHKS